MRILHLDSGKSMRGGQWQVLLLIQGLAEAGVDQILLAPAGSPLAEKATTIPIGVYDLRMKTVLMAASEVDLIHAHDARSHTMAILQRKKPVIVARRVAFPVKWSPLSRWKYGRPAKFIAVSQFVAGVLRQAGVPEEKIALVYDGVPLGEPAQSRGWIVAAATEDPAKGSTLLREARCEVRFSEDLPRDIQYAAVFAYITFSEGLGSSALLAMAAGVPVVASRVGGLVEVVEDGSTGLLVENNSVQIRNAIATILHDPRLAADMGAKARQRVKEHFSANQMVRKTIKVYEEVLA